MGSSPTSPTREIFMKKITFPSGITATVSKDDNNKFVITGLSGSPKNWTEFLDRALKEGAIKGKHSVP